MLEEYNIKRFTFREKEYEYFIQSEYNTWHYAEIKGLKQIRAAGLNPKDLEMHLKDLLEEYLNTKNKDEFYSLNKETLQVMIETELGENLNSFDSLDDMFDSLVEPC